MHAQLNMTKPCHCYGVLLFIGICNKTNTFYFIFLTLLYPFPVNKKNISFSIVRKYLVAFWWSVKKKKTHLGIHSFSPTCLVLLFTCLVGFVFFCNYWRKKKEKRMKKCKVVMKREREEWLWRKKRVRQTFWKGFLAPQVNFFVSLGERDSILKF